MRALKGRKRFLPPFQGLDQILYFSRGFTPGYYLSRFQRSERGTYKIRCDQQILIAIGCFTNKNMLIGPAFRSVDL
jgi:hypothetical protein